MIQRQRRRLLALVALAGFVLSGASEARALNPCSHHDALLGSLASDAASRGGSAVRTAAHDGGHAAPEKGHHASPSHEVGTSGTASAGDVSDAHSGHAEDHGCTCLGSCDAPTHTSLSLPSERHVDVGERTVASSTHALVEWTLHSSRALPLLPFPTAPPSIA